MALNFNQLIPIQNDSLMFCAVANYATDTQTYYMFFIGSQYRCASMPTVYYSEDGGATWPVSRTASGQGRGSGQYTSIYSRPFTSSYVDTPYNAIKLGAYSKDNWSGTKVIVPDGLSGGLLLGSLLGPYCYALLVNVVDGTLGDVPDDVDYVASYTDTDGTEQTVTLNKVTANHVFFVTPPLDLNRSKNITVTAKAQSTLTITNNVDNSSVDYSGDNPYTLTVTASDGYKFSTSPTASYINSEGETQSDTFQLSEDNKTATLTTATVDASNLNITIDGTTTPETVEPTITNNIANSTASYSGSGHQYVVTVKANDGYLFSGDVEASYKGYSSDSPVSVTFVVSDDKKTASGVCPDVDENTPIVLTGETVEETVITVVNNIDGTTETHTYDGTTFAVTVYGGYYHYRYKTIGITYTNVDGEAAYMELATVIDSDKENASGTATVKNGTTVYINGTYEKVCAVESSLSNCYVTDTLPSYLFKGDSVAVTVKANAGTYFEETPYFHWINSASIGVTQQLELDDSSKTAIGTYTVPSDFVPVTVTIKAAATPEKVIGANYGTINVYKVTLDNLDAFSKARFFKEATNSDGTEFTLINLGNYVNRLKRLFLTVPVASTDVIKCGNYNTGVECEAPDTDTVTLNFGSITVPSPNGDATDYLSELQLFVPFKGYVSLPIDYIGKTITLTYTINVITGGGVAKVMCGDDTVLMIDVEPNEDILYQTNLDNLATIGGDTWNEQYLYGIEPFLYVKYYNSLNKDGRNNDYYENAKLGDLSGFCEVDDVTLSTTAEMTPDDQESIISLLQRGVYFQ